MVRPLEDPVSESRARLRPAFSPPFDFRRRIREALREDLGDAGDVTTNAVFDEEARSRAIIVAKEEGILCGQPVIRAVFDELDPKVDIATEFADGDRVYPGDVVTRLEGRVRSLLAGERLALNFVQRLSGVATLTSRFVAAAGGRLEVCDTRKTTPLWRSLEKYAVACGGGTNHRFGLHDMVMIKDTHADGAGGLANALERVHRLRPRLTVAVEVRNHAEVRVALNGDVDLIMLDNMSIEEMREAISLIEGRIPVEITGGVTLETIGAMAELGVDRVSIGALTHSVRALDFSMRIQS